MKIFRKKKLDMVVLPSHGNSTMSGSWYFCTYTKIIVGETFFNHHYRTIYVFLNEEYFGEEESIIEIHLNDIADCVGDVLGNQIRRISKAIEKRITPEIKKKFTNKVPYSEFRKYKKRVNDGTKRLKI